MNIKISKHTSEKVSNRLKKKIRIRKTVKGTSERPRLCVFRSLNHIYAQLVNDDSKKTMFSFSSLNIDEKLSGNETAKVVGKKIAELSLAKGISSVVFDRNGFIYHGRIKSLADGAREAGLNF